MSKYLFIFILSFFIYSCASSPRYRTGPQKPSKSKNKTPVSLKTKSNIKHRKVINGVSSFYAKDFQCQLKPEKSTPFSYAMNHFVSWLREEFSAPVNRELARKVYH